MLATAVLTTAACVTGQLTAGTGTVQAAVRPGVKDGGVTALPTGTDLAGTWSKASQALMRPLLAAARDVRGRPVDCRRVKCVALTFDDGPGPYTDALLRRLKAHRARATFFVVGQNVTAYPAILRRTVAAGHEIGGHTWSHANLTRLPAAAVRAEFARTDQAIKAATGLVPRLIRPPYGALNASVRMQSTRPMVMWSVDTLDWLHRDSARVTKKALKAVRPGSIVLFHDIHPTTVRAMPGILKTLSARGYTFVTVSQLFGGNPPPVAYSGASSLL
ncbi:polysaccharide deacetylase family protein [Nonomuraea turcica]|uniref:polysaccharide deacetylase family protein n=1 Tax=Nonomuraea sp. G32 TaxID=3067274 RepID=UPI00273ADE0A|nr:polysaccharide deacetylase family protein [Nonomuraea sp. G32]MDP4507075.1 polysaccharide deacetylase family protein [Nonomuraea sp. G32]